MTHPEYVKQLTRAEIVRAIAAGLLVFSILCLVFLVIATG